MIQMQIIERTGADLHAELSTAAMRSGSLQNLLPEESAESGVLHTTFSTPGWMKWAHEDGVITLLHSQPQEARHGVGNSSARSSAVSPTLRR